MIVILLALISAVVTLLGTPPAIPDASPTPVHDHCILVTSIPYEAEYLYDPNRPENEQIIATIENQIHGENSPATLDPATVYAVKSEDFSSSVWFIAGQIVGPDFADQGATAVWGTSTITDDGAYTGKGMILSVNDIALTYSDWIDGGQTDARLSMEDDGAQDALDCARGTTDDD